MSFVVVLTPERSAKYVAHADIEVYFPAISYTEGTSPYNEPGLTCFRNTPRRQLQGPFTGDLMRVY